MSAFLNDVRVGADLALVDDAVLVRVQELDRILDGDDVAVVSVLILSIIAASVVDLPEPVGPVTSTSPRGLLAQLRDDRRQAELVEA